MKECLYFSLQNKDLFSIWFINLLFKGIAAYSYSNTKRFSELKLETQARFHWYWPILQGRCKLKECLYLAGQSKETSFSVLDLLTCQLFIFLLLFLFFSLIESYTAIVKWRRALEKWSNYKVTLFFLVFNSFLYVHHDNSNNLVFPW